MYPNSAHFWNRKLIKNKKIISKSPIFIHKNKFVIHELKEIHGKLLDVGFGYGFIEELITNFNLKISLYGIDISDFAVNSAKNKFKGIFKKANIYKIPYNNNSFDCVLALDILEHLEPAKIQTALLEIKRVLKGDGLFIVSVPLNESRKDKSLNGHLRNYNAITIRRELTRSGFGIYKEKYLYAFKDHY
ncbi:MAG: class I SAM-dependent methyltransferase, partial [Candidatus Woesebacteria bacterium]|nr:class I SAM-dependent methyltransferase [Candidatus Woesebacteria bacterium]